MNRFKGFLAGSIVTVVAVAVSGQGTSVLDFEGFAPTSDLTTITPPGLVTTLSATIGGVTVTITRTSGAAFDVYNTTVFPTFFPVSWGTQALDPFTTLGTVNDYFLVTFSAPVSVVAVQMADNGSDVDDLELMGFTSLDGSGTAVATAPPTSYSTTLPTFIELSISGSGMRSALFRGGAGVGFENSVYCDNLSFTPEGGGGGPIDSDGDGLSDDDEINIHGTDPNDADSDDDGLSDGDEIVLGADPLNPDTDGDTLLDGDEVDAGTDPVLADTDGDGLTDEVDVQPLIPGTTSGQLEDMTRLLCDHIRHLDLSLFSGNHYWGKRVRRWILGFRCRIAAHAISHDDFPWAVYELILLRERVDDAPVPSDWMNPSPEKTQLADDVGLLIALLLL